MTKKNPTLALPPNALSILQERYLLCDDQGEICETPQQLFERVAESIAAAEDAFGTPTAPARQAFLDCMLSLDFLPNSPTLMNAGTPLGQLGACFVLPVEDSIAGIYKSVMDSAIVQSSGGGVGFSFSSIRPKGDAVRGSLGLATGPMSFMPVFDATTECIKQSKKHRGANMGILNVDHPDIEEFINSKASPGPLANFNLSVGVSDTFIQAVKEDADFPLRNPRTNEVARVVRAKSLFDRIVDVAWNTGDPGMLYLDRINRDNPTPHLGSIQGTNPCGETPLLPYESCILGSLNIANMVVENQVDWRKLETTIATAIRFLDDVIEVNHYPIPEIKAMTLANRKIGLGVMGWADALIKLQIPYDSEEALVAAEELMEYISFHAKLASVALARERGRFPEYDKSTLSSDAFWTDMGVNRTARLLRQRPMTDWPELLKQLKQDGIRNATVTTIAPTGSISTIADVSSGMEPLYAVAYARRVGDADTFTMNSRFMEMVEDAKLDDSVVEEAKRRGNLAGAKHVPEAIRRLFVTSLEIDPEWHVKMQAAFQKYVDNAVSKTVNMRAESTRDDVANVYLLAHELGCKGITVYRDGSKRDQVLTGGIQRSTYLNALPSANPTGKLPANSYSANTPEGRMYLFVREKDAKPFDIFVILGRAGSDITAFTEAIGRLLSICFRSSIPIDILAENLMGLGGRTSMGFGPERILSVPDAIGKFLEKEYGSESHSHGRRGELCPDCKNASLEYTEGCLKCVICGFSEC